MRIRENSINPSIHARLIAGMVGVVFTLCAASEIGQAAELRVSG